MVDFQMTNIAGNYGLIGPTGKVLSIKGRRSWPNKSEFLQAIRSKGLNLDPETGMIIRWFNQLDVKG